jgi:hypothetical protein
MNALVVYESTYGNTAEIGEAIDPSRREVGRRARRRDVA